MSEFSWVVSVAIILCGITPGQAQTAWDEQPVNSSDTTECARYGGPLTGDNMAECGRQAFVNNNNLVAMEWWRRGANKQSVSAQLGLASMYVDGATGVPQDYVQAYKWYGIAAATVAAYRDEVARKMTTAQIAEAQRLAREWKPGK